MKKVFVLIIWISTGLLAHGQCWQMLQASGGNCMGIKTDGSLWGWGYNNYGELGTGNTTQSTVPVKIGNSTWKMVSNGGAHTVAIKSDGTLWTWGYNSDGQLGDSTTTNRLSPMQIGTATDWDVVSAGLNHCLALKTDGSLWGWGNNSNHAMGNIDLTADWLTPRQLGSSIVIASFKFKHISAGNDSGLAIKTDGKLYAWGYNAGGVCASGNQNPVWGLTQVGTDTDWKEVSTRYYHTVGIKEDGTLWVWGNSTDGALGLGSATTFKFTPTKVGTDTDWKTAQAGDYHTLAIKNNGKMYACGANLKGQLGNSSLVDHFNLVQVGSDSDWDEITAGLFHSAAIKTNGSTYVFGDKNYGGLGFGSPSGIVTTPTLLACPTVGIEELAEATTLTVFPNPSTGLFHIPVLDGIATQIQITDMLGRHHLLDTTDGLLDISHLPGGAYLIRVDREKGMPSLVAKIIKAN